MFDAGPSSLPVERSIYVSNIISAILYGVLLYMVFQSYFLLKSLKKEAPGKRKFYVTYSFTQLILVTVEFSCNGLAGQLMWIDHREFPGGPFAYYLSISSKWFGVLVTASEVISCGMADGLLLYRCYIIWSANRRIIVLPCILYLAELGMGVLVPIELALSDVTFLAKPSTNFSIPWIALEATLTLMLTTLIIGRIIYVAHETRLNTDYTGTISMLVESAVPLSLAGVGFAVCVGTKSLPEIPLANIWGSLVAISPQSIILRVAMGRAWTEGVARQLTKDIEFAHNKHMLGTSSVGEHGESLSEELSNAVV